MKLARAFVALLCVSAAAACSDSTGPPSQRPVVTVTPGTAELAIGESRSLTATVQRASNTAVTWRSSAPAVAQVSDAGRVTALSSGTAMVVALSVQDTMARDSAVITVTGNAPLLLSPLGIGAVNDRFTAEVAVRGDRAYTSTWGNRNGNPGNVVKIWDVAGAVPVLVDSLRITGASTTGDVQISDDGSLLVVAVEYSPNGAIVIYDRNNTPSRPQQLSRYASPSTAPGVHTVKLGRVAGRHYAFLSIDPAGSPARLVIVDITNPSAPFEVWSQTMGAPFVHDVFVRDGLLFTALWNDGMRIYDIGGGQKGGTPANPVVVGEIRETGSNTRLSSIHNIWWFKDPRTGTTKYVFLGEEGPGAVPETASGDIHVIDISNPAVPVKVATYSVPGAGTHNFWMDEQSGILYAAYYNGGVRAIDVRGDLGTCPTAQKTTGPVAWCDLRKMGRELAIGLVPGNAAYVWGVVYQGTHVYASDMRLGLLKFDVSALLR